VKLEGAIVPEGVTATVKGGVPKILPVILPLQAVAQVGKVFILVTNAGF
jgi:hypothetical protein